MNSRKTTKTTKICSKANTMYSTNQRRMVLHKNDIQSSKKVNYTNFEKDFLSESSESEFDSFDESLTEIVDLPLIKRASPKKVLMFQEDIDMLQKTDKKDHKSETKASLQ